MNRMNTPSTRAEFERNFNLLHHQIVEGKLHFAQGLRRSLDGLMRVRHLPNGRIDFLSVDESARNLANSSSQFSEENFPNMMEEEVHESDDGNPTSDKDQQ